MFSVRINISLCVFLLLQAFLLLIFVKYNTERVKTKTEVIWRQAASLRTGVTTPKSPITIRNGTLSNTMLLGTTRVSLPNGIALRSAALAGCTSVTECVCCVVQQTDR